MSISDDVTRLRTLRNAIDSILSPLMPRDGRLTLLDFPDHSNVGDSAIWLGEIQYLRDRHNITPRYVSALSAYRADDLARALPRGPIFLHGGGNFGDCWPEHQHFREMLLQACPDRAIVQLPQSIQYDDNRNLERSARIINDHPDFTLLVRDDHSYRLAKSAFTCNVELCPDMAFCLGFQRRSGRPEHSLLLLLRTDKESGITRPSEADLPAGAVMADWVDEPPDIGPRVRGRLRFRWPLLGFRVLDANLRREIYYRSLAANRLRRGLRQLASASHVITDRLHGHILCLLSCIPHTILDNNYGKLRRFEQTWTRGLGRVRVADDLADAIARSRRTDQED